MAVSKKTWWIVGGVGVVVLVVVGAVLATYHWFGPGGFCDETGAVRLELVAEGSGDTTPEEVATTQVDKAQETAADVRDDADRIIWPGAGGDASSVADAWEQVAEADPSTDELPLASMQEFIERDNAMCGRGG